MHTVQLLEECTYRFVRSGGKGGQNVNKVATKVLLQFDVTASKALSDEERERVLLALASRLTQSGVLQITCDSSRSQFANKEEANKKLLHLLTKSLIVKKKRIALKVPKAVKRKRAEQKKKISEKKANRKKINL